jgi:hypothetical protein
MAMLTAAGRQRLSAAAPTHLDGVRRLFIDALDEKQMDALSDGFSEVVSRTVGATPSDCD